MNSFSAEEKHFASLADEVESAATREGPTPSRLKAKIYSELIRHQEASGPLLNLPETKAEGQGICVFEELVRISPVGEKAKSFNCCRLCHARLLAEWFENAPIYWASCPYVGFQNR